MGIAQLTQSNEFIARRLVAFSLYVLATISMVKTYYKNAESRNFLAQGESVCVRACVLSIAHVCVSECV